MAKRDLLEFVERLTEERKSYEETKDIIVWLRGEYEL